MSFSPKIMYNCIKIAERAEIVIQNKSEFHYLNIKKCKKRQILSIKNCEFLLTTPRVYVIMELLGG